MTTFIQSISGGSRVLFFTGLVHFMLALLFLVLMGWDSRQVNAENVWLKPFRFAVSIFLFTWTYAWFSRFYVRQKRLVNVLTRIIAVCMFVEIALITMQSGRGVASHFNVSSPFDAAVFSVMGAVIGFNALLTGVMFVVFVWFEKGGGDYRWSVIWGMFLFLLGNFAGYLIIRYGWPDAALQFAEQLPVTGWKKGLKDMRIPHAIGLHAIQVLPVSMWLIIRSGSKKSNIHWVGGAYLALYFFSLLVAMA
jgi:hypothetical protein